MIIVNHEAFLHGNVFSATAFNRVFQMLERNNHNEILRARHSTHDAFSNTSFIHVKQRGIDPGVLVATHAFFINVVKSVGSVLLLCPTFSLAHRLALLLCLGHGPCTITSALLKFILLVSW